MEPFETIAENFAFLDDWEDRFRYLMDLGRALEPLSDHERSEANKVHGCASQVWLIAEAGADGTLRFRGDSDALLVKGIVAVVLALFDGRTPAEIASLDAEAALSGLGLREHLTAQRSNGLTAMLARIRSVAVAAAKA
ncbi:MAG: SufE family protein [Hyphomicrobiaceae bacterium]|nr:SufE family protein [Hyphomicrobiaceae bacterium]